jgi:hypothetical protein
MDNLGQARQPDGRPLLLLDIDGVLNAFPAWTSRRDYERHEIDGYPISFHHEVREMVGELRKHYDISWFTLWNHKAAPLIGPHVGLEDAPFLETSWDRGADILMAQGVEPEQVRLIMYAKTPLLTELVDNSQRWVWIDDAHSDRDRDYLEYQGFVPENFRLIRTDGNPGLTWIEVQEAVTLARAWAAGEAPEATSPADSGASGAPHIRPGSIAGRSDAVE